MSFQEKSFWVPRDAGFMANGEMNFVNSSKIEPKRGHQWLLDGTSPELLSNKRQATDSIKENAIPEVSSIGVSTWDNNANIQPISGPFADRLFGSHSIQSSTLVDRNIAPYSAGDGKYVENQFANGSSCMGLSLSHGIDDPSSFYNYDGGLRKVRINQVGEQEKSIPSPMESFYRRETDASMISLGPSHLDMNENSISMATGYSKGDESFISMGHGFNKEGGNFMGPNYNNHGSFIPMGHSYKGAENFIPMNSLHKDNDDNLSIGHSFDKVDANSVHIDPILTYSKGDSGILSMGHNGNGVGNTISFGGFCDGTEANVSGAMIDKYGLVIDAEGSIQASEVQNQNILVDSNTGYPNLIVNTTPSNSNVNSRADNPTKNKDQKTAKKPPANNFPSNVKSLLSTGILDGVPVKYVSWSREKNMKGIIKGTGYLCGCSNCNHTKSLNAYEFERHADCKTKHPNNHIYFDNGKTIYAVVQELKNTPQDRLFDAIETVTGSAINQKNFHAWKASYQAATRELKRIYGKDQVKLPC